MASDLPQVFDLGQLLGAPLVALVDADAQAATRFAEFIRQVGFTGAVAPVAGPISAAPPSESLGTLRTVQFRYKRAGPDGRPRDGAAEIPMLSLVPLPKLQVDQAEFTFCVRIVGGTPAPVPAHAAMPSPAVHLSGAIAHAADTPAARQTPGLQGNLTVKLMVRQADTPSGLSHLLNIMGNSAIAGPVDGGHP